MSELPFSQTHLITVGATTIEVEYPAWSMHDVVFELVRADRDVDLIGDRTTEVHLAAVVWTGASYSIGISSNQVL